MTITGNHRNHEDNFEYRKSLKKSRGNFIGKMKYIDLYLNRPVASLIVRMVYHTPVTPNGLTYISFVLGILGAGFIAGGKPLYFIVGGILTQLSSIIDGADGMLARAKNKCSDFGAHLDLFLDRIIDFSLMVGIGFGAGIYFKSSFLLLIGLLTAGLYLLQVNLFYLTRSYLQAKQTGELGEARAILMLCILVFAVINRLDILLYLGFIETVINNLVRFFYFISLGRKKKTLSNNE